MKMKNDQLGNRMKRYESVFKHNLIPRSYTVIRLDGKAFHTYTKGLNKPFDKGLVEDMIETTKHLCQNIQGCKLGYVQSDEISLLLTDFDTHETQPWLGNEIQKILSISASLATSYFNHLRLMRKYPESSYHDLEMMKLANFDSRVFQVPNLTEAYNCFLWRQKDCIRNSISASAQSLYSHKQLNGIGSLGMLEMISDKAENFYKKIEESGFEMSSIAINGNNQTWHMLPNSLKFGTSIVKEFDCWVEKSFEFNYEWFDLNIINNI